MELLIVQFDPTVTKTLTFDCVCQTSTVSQRCHILVMMIKIMTRILTVNIQSVEYVRT